MEKNKNTKIFISEFWNTLEIHLNYLIQNTNAMLAHKVTGKMLT